MPYSLLSGYIFFVSVFQRYHTAHYFQFIYFTISDVVRYIHSQRQAQAQIERMQPINMAKYARRKQRMKEDLPYKARLRATDFQVQETLQNKKRKAIEDDPLDVDVRKDADRMANT